MIDPRIFYEKLESEGIDFYVGVPDSLLANFCSYVDTKGKNHHLISANEGNAVAIAVGYHLSTNKIAAVYMQNSGLGNSINPLVSLADPSVYKIPMLLIIGWRGEPGLKDEPQHKKQGEITLRQLDTLDIPYLLFDANSDVKSIVREAIVNLNNRSAPVAIVVKKDTFKKNVIKSDRNRLNVKLLREKVLEKILKLTDENDLIISTTGKTSREIFELRKKNNITQRDFLTVGGMGHVSSIALGVAIGNPKRRVICLDGDGSLLMHMGSLPVISKHGPRKFIHILLNNNTHESVGGQPTSADVIDFEKMVLSIGYTAYEYVDTLEDLKNAWISLLNKKGPVMLEVKIKNGSRKNLGRPTTSPEENKIAFMRLIR